MDWMEQRKAALKRDFESVTEKSWNHFYCPILYRDEDAELCRAHVINEAFREADRSWTVQRADVDNYYGSLFEADFVAMDKKDDPIVEEALVDKNVARQFRPKFVLDGDVKEHYIPSDVDSVPEGHTTFAFHLDDSIVPYTLKLAPEQVTQSLDGRWEVLVDKDIQACRTCVSPKVRAPDPVPLAWLSVCPFVWRSSSWPGDSWAFLSEDTWFTEGEGD